MIRVTRLNGRPFVINAEQIRFVEAASEHDTSITMLGGEKVTVRESVEEVVRRAIDFGRQLRTFSS